MANQEQYHWAANELLSIINNKTSQLVTHPDGGLLRSYLSLPINFPRPTKFYPHASPGFDQYREMRKEWLTKDFITQSSKHPEKYARSVMAWLAKIGKVTLDEEHTQEVLDTMIKSVQKQDPIKLCLTYSLQKYPLAKAGTDIKCITGDPDLAELELLHLLFSLNEVLKKSAYPPGVKIVILNEAKAFTHFPAPEEDPNWSKFEEKVNTWIKTLGYDGIIKVENFLERCTQKNEKYLNTVNQMNLLNLASLKNEEVTQNPFIKAESRSVYWPGIGLETDINQLLRLYGSTGVVPLLGLNINWDSILPNDLEAWEKVANQALIQAAYFRAFMDTRSEVGGVLQDDEIAITVTEAKNKITIPTFLAKPQERTTHWSNGIKILPGHGVSLSTKEGVAILPAVSAVKKANKILFSEELNVNCLATYE